MYGAWRSARMAKPSRLGTTLARSAEAAAWCLGADELTEEPTLREDLVDQDGPDRVDPLVRLEVQEIIWDRPPDAGGLVGLADISCDEVLEQRIVCLRNLLVGYGD